MKQSFGMRQIRDWGAITVGTLIVAAAVFFFLIPSHLVVGSVSGLAVVLSNFVPLPVSYITMALNILFLTLGFVLVGREFGGKTIYTSLLLPAAIRVFEKLLPEYHSIMGEPFLDMLCYCLTVSIGLALLFQHNASSGGLDIAAKILNKYLRMELGTAMALAGICVALSSALVYDGKTVILSMIGTYLGGIILDHFLFGMNVKRKVCIVSERVQEIRDYVIEQLHSGATLYQAIGAYQYQPRQEIVVIVDKSEYSKLMSYLSSLDPNAFVTVYTVSEINYKPKRWDAHRLPAESGSSVET